MRRPAVAVLLATVAAHGLGASAAIACALHVAPASQGLGSPYEVIFPSPAGGLPKLAAGPFAQPHAARKPARRLKTTHRLRLVGHVDPGQGYNGDVYAHRGHAYLSSWGGPSCPADGVRVYDLSNPRRPVRISTFADDASEPALAGTWSEKTIVQHVATPAFAGELAVTSLQNCQPGAFRGFAVYDVTNPRAPRKLALVRTEPRGSHEIWLQPRGGRAYVYTAIIHAELMSGEGYDPRTSSARAPGLADFRIFDVTNPTAPVEVGSWGAWRTLGITPYREELRGFSSFVHSVIVNAAGTRAYLSHWDFGTVILDVSDPTAPRYLGRTGDADNAHSTALARNGTVLIETHETRSGVPVFFDVSNAQRPRRLGQLRLPATSRPVPAGNRPFANGVHDARVKGNRAYFSWYSQGVLAVDITRPARPRVLAQFLPPLRDDPGDANCKDVSCRIVWGVSIYGDYVLASDMLSGLYVLKLEARTTRRT